MNPNTIGLVSTSVLLAAMSIRTLVLRLAVMGPIVRDYLPDQLAGGGGCCCCGTGDDCVASLACPPPAGAVACRDRTHIGCRRDDRIWRCGVQDVGSVLWPKHSDRGISSGATGRVMAWKWTWDLFVHNPVLGVGFRAHEYLLKADSSSHNGYLATLAEIGVLGFLGVLFLVARGLKLLWAGSESRARGSVKAYCSDSVSDISCSRFSNDI